jgi:hypothetical protein
MNKTRGMIVSIFFISLTILAVILFWSAIYDYIIMPIALTVWLLLRIFILSIDQKYYWWALIFAALVIAYRLLQSGKSAAPAQNNPENNETMTAIDRWHSLFSLVDNHTRDEKALKQELIHLVASVYASKQHVSPNFLFYDALKNGEISLPAHVHAYLFPDDSPKKSRSLKTLAQNTRQAARKWLRQWNGQAAADHYRMINEILNIVDTSLENKNDIGTGTPNEN